MPKWAVGAVIGQPEQAELRNQHHRNGDHRAARAFHAADDGKHRAGPMAKAMQIAVIQVNGVVHGDAENDPGNQHGSDASPEARREVITSRPWLMSSVGRRTEHAEQTTITLSGLHADFDKARQLLMQVSARLQAWAKNAAEQLQDVTVWRCVCPSADPSICAMAARRAAFNG